MTKRQSNTEKSVGIADVINGTSVKRIRGEDIKSHYGVSEYADEKSFVVSDHAQDTDNDNMEIEYDHIPAYQAHKQHKQKAKHGILYQMLHIYYNIDTVPNRLTIVQEADGYDETSKRQSKILNFDQTEGLDQSQIMTSVDSYLKCPLNREPETLEAISKPLR